RTCAIRHLFLFIGADPNTDWLVGSGIALDDKGFIRTGVNFQGSLETNLPGVFAIGDVRSGSVKRVAAAVGDGAQVVAALHRFLQKPTAVQWRQPRLENPDGLRMLPRIIDPRCEAERARMRGMPEDRLAVGTPALMPDLRPCRVLRRLTEPTCDTAFPCDTPPDHRRVRSFRRLGMVLPRRGDA